MEQYNEDNILIFKGKILNGLKKGLCLEYNDEGVLTFKGIYRNNLRNGYGKEYVDGILVYEGNYVNGKRECKKNGKEYIDGILVYCGGFKDGVRDGRGRIYENGKFKENRGFKKGLYWGYWDDDYEIEMEYGDIGVIDFFESVSLHRISCGG